MVEIIWGEYQVEHIEERHGVTEELFRQAFAGGGRVDVESQPRGRILSIGFTHDDRMMDMVWRWVGRGRHAVFPVTAYFPDDVDEDADQGGS